MSKINLDNTIQKIASTSKDIFLDYLMEEKKEREKKVDVIISWIRKSDCDPDYLIKMLKDLKK